MVVTLLTAELTPPRVSCRTVRLMLGKALERAAYEVMAVKDGDHAIKELKKEDPPRLALLDWIMPGKDGVSVCREVRQRKERYVSHPAFLERVEG